MLNSLALLRLALIFSISWADMSSVMRTPGVLLSPKCVSKKSQPPSLFILGTDENQILCANHFYVE